MTKLNLELSGATFGAIVTDISLPALGPAEWSEIEAAFHEYALLVFPDQHLTSGEQVGFATRFGEIEHLLGDSGIVPISNQRGDGSLLAEGEPGMEIMRGNEGWHTDSSYMPVSARASVLSAHIVPKSGGQTEWADMRAAYDALEPAMCDRIAEFSAYHSLRHSQALLGDTSEYGYGYHDGPIPLRPLVKTHPVTGRPSLYIGRHAYGIPGLDEDESAKLLDELLDFACQPPRTHQHEWKPGDIVIWDNRCLMHRARPYDHSEPRSMRHTRIAGDPKTEGF
jgi:alpha-ketoglutarate-dependent taurine dioxygenase